MSAEQSREGRSSTSALDKLTAIADEIFERWDKDQRSGKLLKALMGALPRYRSDVADVRRVLAAHDDLLEMTMLLERSLVYEIKKSASEGDDEGANLKSFTLAMARSAIAAAVGDRPAAPDTGAA